MNFEQRLSGGHPNSLGNTIEVVEEVLKAPEKFDALFACYFSKDEVVRLRVSNAMKRIAKADKKILLPYLGQFLKNISKIDQASTQWTLAQLFDMFENDMNAKQLAQAKKIMKKNLEHHQDWIVLNMTMTTLGKWAKKDDGLKKWIIPHLKRHAKDKRKSVTSKAQKILESL